MYSKSEKYILYKIEKLSLESLDDKVLYKPIAIIQFIDSMPEYINLISFNEFKIINGEIDNDYLLNLRIYDINMNDIDKNQKEVKGINLNDFFLSPIIFNSPKKALEEAKEKYEDVKEEILLKDAINGL